MAFGAPYLPTMNKQREDALDLLDLKPGQKIIELGSGDGRMLNSAAKRGIYSVGYELNPILFVISWVATIKYRKFITIKYGDFWRKKWPQTDGIFVFLHTRFMKKLDKKIIREYKGSKIKVVSYAFEIPGKKAVKRKDAMFLYIF